MTSRLAICFSLAAAWLGTAAACATVSGTISLSKSPTHSGVVVWLESTSGIPPPATPATIRVAHKNKTFVPSVVAARAGSKIQFPNLDPFFHNAFSNYEGQVFDVGLHAPGSTREVTLRRPGVVRLFCNIHPTMSAVIVVLDSPWFTTTNAKGAFRIADVPAGEYKLHVFYERALPNVLDALRRSISIGADELALPPITISEAGYLAPPHKNKYGKDYPAVIVDQYPGRKP